MTLDWLRWFALAEGAFVLGTLVALFQRAWRFALPAGTTRVMMVAGVMLVVALMSEVQQRLGTPLTWRTPLVVGSLTLYLGALLRLYMWYRQPRGRKVRHEMIASYFAERMLREAEHREGDQP